MFMRWRGSVPSGCAQSSGGERHAEWYGCDPAGYRVYVDPQRACLCTQASDVDGIRRVRGVSDLLFGLSRTGGIGALSEGRGDSDCVLHNFDYAYDFGRMCAGAGHYYFAAGAARGFCPASADCAVDAADLAVCQCDWSGCLFDVVSVLTGRFAIGGRLPTCPTQVLLPYKKNNGVTGTAVHA